MEKSNGNRYANYAPELVTNGYDVTPLNGKIPILSGWQNRPPEAQDYQKYAPKNIGVSYSPKWCLASDSSGDQVSLCHLDTVFKLYPGYQLGQVVEAA